MPSSSSRPQTDPSASSELDVLVCGGGPAGLEAALLLGRCMRRVLVVDAGRPRNEASRAVHGFLSRDGIAPRDLLGHGRQQLARYGVPVERGEVEHVERRGGVLLVRLVGGRTLRTKHFLLASGVTDLVPDVEGLAPRLGTSVYPCPYCDAWEHRDRKIGVLADGDAGVGFAVTLSHWSRDVVLFPFTTPPSPEGRDRLARRDITLASEPVVAVEGDGLEVEAVVLRSGVRVARDVLFFKGGCGARSELLTRLGFALDEDGCVTTDERGGTHVEGVWAAGDIGPGPKLAIVAAAQGARTAIAIHKELSEAEERDGVFALRHEAARA